MVQYMSEAVKLGKPWRHGRPWCGGDMCHENQWGIEDEVNPQTWIGFRTPYIGEGFVVLINRVPAPTIKTEKQLDMIVKAFQLGMDL